MALRELKLELIQQCTLACVHCSTDSHRRRAGVLPRETVLRLLHEGSAMGVEKVAFSGGEPLLVPFLTEIVTEAKTLGIYSSLYTCGVADFELNPLGPDQARDIVTAGLGRFIFSIYSHNPEVHNSVTRYASFSTTVNSLHNATEAGGNVEIHFVAMRRNFRDLLGLVKAARDWKVGRLSVLRFVPHGRGSNIAEREDLTPAEMRELRDIILAARAMFPDMNVRTGSPYNTLGVGQAACDAAQEVLSINHRGEVFPCDAFKNVKYADARFGSILNCPLKEIWEKSAFLNRVRKELDAGPMKACGSCSEFSGCRSECLAQKVIRDGWGRASEYDLAPLVQITNTPNSPAPLDTNTIEFLVQVQ